MTTRRFNLYNTHSTSSHSSVSSRVINNYGSTYINLREEFNQTIDEIGRQGLLRKMRRDSNGNLTECSCNNTGTLEAPKNPICPLCLGEKYLWDEELIDFYVMEAGYDTSMTLREESIKPGNLAIPLKIFFIRYDEQLTEDDKVVELELDTEGNIETPAKRRGIYRISSLLDYRLDDGKLQFWKAAGYRDKMAILNPTIVSEV